MLGRGIHRYKMEKLIGKGVFGEIWKATDVLNNETVAIKMEYIRDELLLLKNEAIIYNYIQHQEGFVTLKYYGANDDVYFMVMDLLGKNITQMKNDNEIDYTLAIFLFYQMILRIQYLHENQLIHQDIKPDNFMMDNKNENILYLIDLGFCKKYKTATRHIPIAYNKSIIGTPHFVSENILNGIQGSRRDDLISIFYIFIFCIVSNDKWTELNSNLKKSEDKPHKIQLLYETNIISKRVIDIFNYLRNLTFTENPDYNYIIEIILLIKE
jgi:serine/threonine protein kinase